MSDDLEEGDNDSIKVILIGEMATGKTSLINVYFGLNFRKMLDSTFSPSVSQKELKIGDKSYIIHMWDTAGQEKYRSMTKIFVKESQIVIFVYDVTDEYTFTELGYWVKTIEEILGKEPQLAVVGNKIDLFEKQVVSKERGKTYANQIGAMFCETSAKEDAKGFGGFVDNLVKEFLNKKGYFKNEGQKLTNAKVKKKKKCPC